MFKTNGVRELNLLIKNSVDFMIFIILLWTNAQFNLFRFARDSSLTDRLLFPSQSKLGKVCTLQSVKTIPIPTVIC